MGLLDCFDYIVVEPFMPHGAFITLDIGILLRIAWLNVLDDVVAFARPFQKFAGNIFRAIIDPYACWLEQVVDFHLEVSRTGG